MTRAMQIVQALTPHSLTGQNIDLGAAGAAGELAEFNLDMPLQYQRIDFLLLIRERSEGDGTGDVCRTVEILSATVEQQQTLWLQGYIGLWRSLVMNDGSMLAIARDGIEGDVSIERLLSTEGGEFLVDGDFGQRF